MGAFKNESLSLPEKEGDEVGAIAHSAPSPFFSPSWKPLFPWRWRLWRRRWNYEPNDDKSTVYVRGGREEEGRLFLLLFLLGWPPFPPACRHATDTQGLHCEK